MPTTECHFKDGSFAKYVEIYNGGTVKHLQQTTFIFVKTNKENVPTAVKTFQENIPRPSLAVKNIV